MPTSNTVSWLHPVVQVILALYTFEQYLELHQKHIVKEDKNLDGLLINQGELVPCFF